MRPPEIEKPPAGTDGSEPHMESGKVRSTSYGPGPDRASQLMVRRCDSRTASNGHLRLVYDAELKARVLEKAGCEVRRSPQTLSLWGFRLAQHVNVGTFGFTEAWETLETAALDAGVCETRVTRILYASFADSMKSPAPPMPLTVLRGGVH